MRSEPTDAEAKLWRGLRGSQFDGFKFRRQHPVGRYILDFYCADAGLAIELDGGQHAEPEQETYDQRREQALGQAGIRVLRFWDNEVLKNTAGVLQAIWDALHGLSVDRDEAPSPQPSPQGRGSEEGEGAEASENPCI